MTYGEAKKVEKAMRELKAMGIKLTYNREWEEYRVNQIGAGEATAYYTADLQDAVGTGEAMAAHNRQLVAKLLAI